MPTTTPVQGLPIPVLGDVTNPPQHIQTLAQALEKQLVMVFATAASRASQLPSPADGALSYRQDAKIYEYYNAAASAWRAFGSLHGVASPISGSLSAPVVPLINAGTPSPTVTTNASAIGVFNWPTAFPNGVLSVVMTSLTDTVPQLRVVGSGGTTVTQCQFVARTNTGAAATNTPVPLSYIAIGW